jgi:4-aminobutyrate aminotransferase
LAQAAVERDEAVTSPSHTRPYPLVVKQARGSVIEDVDGNRFLDFTAGIAVCTTGHCHPEVVAAIREQADHLIHMCGSDFYYSPMIELAEKLASMAPGDEPKRVYFTNSGAETIESAFKLARHHTNRKWVISFYGAFHGRTMGALALTSSKARQKERFGPLTSMVAHVDYADCHRCPLNLTYPECDTACVADIENTLFKREVPPDEVAAIFVEPVMGEGGYIVPPSTFLPKLRKLCDRHGILLVADEIQTGMGRTGRMFACEHTGVVPDILCLAKGLASGMPLGAVVAPGRIMNWPAGSHGSTFGGNPVSCAASLATIDLLERQLVDNARQLGEVGMRKLDQMAARRKCLSHVQGLGLMIGVEVVKSRDPHRPDPKMRDRIIEEAFQRGLLLLGCGESAIRVCPPLCINRAQLEVGLDVFDEAVATVAG